MPSDTNTSATGTEASYNSPPPAIDLSAVLTRLADGQDRIAQILESRTTVADPTVARPTLDASGAPIGGLTSGRTDDNVAAQLNAAQLAATAPPIVAAPTAAPESRLLILEQTILRWAPMVEQLVQVAGQLSGHGGVATAITDVVQRVLGKGVMVPGQPTPPAV